MASELRVETHGPPQARRADVRCGPLRAQVDAASGSARVVLPSGSELVIGASAGPPLPADARRAWPLLVIGEVKGLAGPALRIEVQRAGAEGVGLRLALEIDRAGHGIAAFASLENRTAAELALEALTLLHAPGARPAARCLLAPGDDATPVGWIDPNERASSLVAFTTSREASVRASEDALSILSARARLAPGARSAPERIWIGAGDEPGVLATEWARRAGVEMHVRSPLRVPVLVCGDAAHEQAEAARAIAAWSPGAALERSVTPDAAGLVDAERHASACTSLGMRCAFRVALPPAHDVAELPPWLARVAALDPLCVTIDGLICAAGGLRDATRALAAPDARALESRAVEQGRMAAIDVARWRATLATVRGALGEAALLVVPQAPFLPSLGLVDALDLGTSRWLRRALALRVALDDPACPSRDDLAAAATTDAVGVERAAASPARAKATPATSLRVDAITGRVLRLALPRDPLTLAALAPSLPPLARLATPLAAPPTRDRVSSRIPLVGERFALLVESTSGADASLLDAALSAALPPEASLFDVDAGAPRSLDALRAAQLPAHGSRMLVVTPRSERHRVVGSTLHEGAGTLETMSLRAESDGTIVARLRLPGPRRGSLWVAPGSDTPLRQAEIAFDDDGTVTL